MKRIVKELLLFVIILVVVAFVIHIDRWLTAPIEHFQNLTNHGLPWHPIFYAIIVYILLLMIRGIFSLLIKKRKN